MEFQKLIITEDSSIIQAMEQLDLVAKKILFILEDGRLKELEQKVAISFWEKADDNHTIIRLATSWATKEEEIKALIEIL